MEEKNVMAYCRFSTNNFQCDVYVYESVNDCWVTHVAYRRWPENMPDDPEECLTDEIFKAGGAVLRDAYAKHCRLYEARKNWMRAHQHLLKEINHPLAGEDFSHETPGECAKFLRQLLNEGFRVPLDVILQLEQEETERTEAI